MEIGVHLPQISWQDEVPTLGHLVAVAERAQELGFGTLSVNDHLVWSRPWLDGPIALAAVSAVAPRVRLMTSVSLPVVRGPVALAKALGSLDRLSGGRVDAGLGPGSSEADYRAAGVPFEERWPRFDEAVRAVRAMWTADGLPFVGRYYDTTGIQLAPGPVQPTGPRIWVGSWGSAAGLRRVARLADGWLASGYNATPELLATHRTTLVEQLEAAGRAGTALPVTLATTWMHVTADAAEAQSMRELVSQTIRRPLDQVAERLPIGSPDACADLLGRYRTAGVDRVLVWPLRDELRQLELFAERVMPQLAA